ncbi:MAG: hypothetical protein JST04_04370 [Bdellovibrionales bacterium]|nr:hypothetical protein [Bdellovibrionales bacterium]
MKTRLAALALTSILASLSLTASARAEDCKTEDQATPKNVYQCELDTKVQLRLVAGYLLNPEVQKTPDFESVVEGIGNFGTAERSTIDPILDKLLNLSDEVLPLKKKVVIADHARDLDGKTSPKIIAFVKNRIIGGAHGCGPRDLVAIRYRDLFPKNDPEISRTIGETMASCSWNNAEEFREVASTINEGYRAAVLPLMDEMNRYLKSVQESPDTDCEGGRGSTWVHDFQESVNYGLFYLGQGRVDRAQSLVEGFLGVKCSVFKNAAQAANEKIQTGINLKNAARGNSDALDWGMDFLQSHNGDYAGIEAQIVNAFFQAAKVSPSAKAKIKRFARDEYNSGYHSGTPKLNGQLKQLANLK